MTLDKARTALKYLTINYPNFKLDVNDEMTVKAWSRPFMNMTAREFGDLVMAYCDNNHYPPQSPLDLLKPLEEKFRARIKPAFEAWRQTVYRLIKADFFHHPNDGGNSLTPACRKAYFELEAEFHSLGLNLADTRYNENLMNRFMKAYEKYQFEEIKHDINVFLSYDHSTPELMNETIDDVSNSIKELAKDYDR